MNHPVTNLGYRIDCNGKSLFFTGDHEPLSNIYEPGSADHEEYQHIIEDRNKTIYEHLDGLDLMIADSSYTNLEYPDRQGWGHGTFASCLTMAKTVGARTLVFTHHEPGRSDEALDVIKTRLDGIRQPGDPEMVVAREGLEINL
jgi:phosphoribosyl 1,2-cyclic phosphodiesterase